MSELDGFAQLLSFCNVVTRSLTLFLNKDRKKKRILSCVSEEQNPSVMT